MEVRTNNPTLPRREVRGSATEHHAHNTDARSPLRKVPRATPETRPDRVRARAGGAPPSDPATEPHARSPTLAIYRTKKQGRDERTGDQVENLSHQLRPGGGGGEWGSEENLAGKKAR